MAGWVGSHQIARASARGGVSKKPASRFFLKFREVQTKRFFLFQIARFPFSKLPVTSLGTIVPYK